MTEPGIERTGARDEWPSDRELMARARHGDAAAFELIVRRYWDSLVSYADRLVGDPDTARDAVQSMFASIWERRAQWQDEQAVRTYFYRAVRNRVIDVHRRTRAWKRWSARVRVEFRRVSPSPAEVAERAELAELIESAIRTLPERRREVFVLAQLQNFSYREVAELLNMAPQTVANHMSLALRDLRKSLGPHFPTRL